MKKKCWRKLINCFHKIGSLLGLHQIFLLDDPFVSDFLEKTLVEFRIPVVQTAKAKNLISGTGINFISENKAIDIVASYPETMIHTNSENALEWIEQNLAFTRLPAINSMFKNKVLFRQTFQENACGFFFQEIRLDELDSVVVETLPLPVVLKPAVGFISLGVHIIITHNDWFSAIKKIREAFSSINHIYPDSVLDLNRLVIEKYIEGEEFAIDAYFDSEGKPVILNIMKHVFYSVYDVSDRIYLMSSAIMDKYRQSFIQYLESIGKQLNLKNYSLHVEVRVDKHNQIIPIEINPMRFGGWCTSADMSWYAYGINTYEYCLNKKKPDWDNILKGKDNLIYGLIVLDNSTGYKASEIKAFDYAKLAKQFEKLLEIRKVDYKTFEVFGFLFTETKTENLNELEGILGSDLTEYITV